MSSSIEFPICFLVVSMENRKTISNSNFFLKQTSMQIIAVDSKYCKFCLGQNYALK